ncbi:caspase family protein [Sphingomonas sp. ID1715]|uniref:caspase family protein n=1 Tax=Sphingomonas sp. ID1715 TaxID=1656898 RepID=UPI001C2C66E3|nr:caspase family protein [Sphingomonas sp. ID1715]
MIAAGLGALMPLAQATSQTVKDRRALIVSLNYFDQPGLFLPNTAGDGRLIKTVLEKLKFNTVNLVENPRLDRLQSAVAALLTSLSEDSIVVVYVAAHGFEIGGENYILLADGQSFFSLSSLVDTVRRNTRMSIFFLDACRSSPLKAAPNGARAFRALSPEAARRVSESLTATPVADLSQAAAQPVRPFSLQGTGVKVVFATDPQNVAADSVAESDLNSPFASSLAKRIAERRSLDDAISLATGDVVSATAGRQSPWSQGSIGVPIYLAGPPKQKNPAKVPFQVPG